MNITSFIFDWVKDGWYIEQCNYQFLNSTTFYSWPFMPNTNSNTVAIFKVKAKAK